MHVFMNASGIHLLQRRCVRANVSYFPFGFRGSRDSVRQIRCRGGPRLVESDVIMFGNATHGLFRSGSSDARNPKSESFLTLEISFGDRGELGNLRIEWQNPPLDDFVT
jgi:hypothetical protein